MTNHFTPGPAPTGATRRAVLAGAGAAATVVVLGGCAAYDSGGGALPPDPDPAGDPAAAGPLAETGDVPVGGAVILSDRRVVVSQPEQGTFKAFSAVCTHQGCLVANVDGTTVVCPCHGSAFNVADGSVANGPANRPLPEVAIAVEGTSITLA